MLSLGVCVCVFVSNVRTHANSILYKNMSDEIKGNVLIPFVSISLRITRDASITYISIMEFVLEAHYYYNYNRSLLSLYRRKFEPNHRNAKKPKSNVLYQIDWIYFERKRTKIDFIIRLHHQFSSATLLSCICMVSGQQLHCFSLSVFSVLLSGFIRCFRGKLVIVLRPMRNKFGSEQPENYQHNTIRET